MMLKLSCQNKSTTDLTMICMNLSNFKIIPKQAPCRDARTTTKWHSNWRTRNKTKEMILNFAPIQLICIFVILVALMSSHLWQSTQAQEFTIGLKHGQFDQQQFADAAGLSYHLNQFEQQPQQNPDLMAERRSANDEDQSDSSAQFDLSASSSQNQQDQINEAQQLHQLHQVVDTVAQLLNEEDQRRRQEAQQNGGNQNRMESSQQAQSLPDQPQASALKSDGESFAEPAQQPEQSSQESHDDSVAGMVVGGGESGPVGANPAELMSESAIRRAIEELERVQKQERARQQQAIGADISRAAPNNSRDEQKNDEISAPSSKSSMVESIVDELGEELLEDQLASASQGTERLIEPARVIAGGRSSSDASIVSVSTGVSENKTSSAGEQQQSPSMARASNGNRQLVMGQLNLSPFVDSELNSALTNDYYSFHEESNSQPQKQQQIEAQAVAAAVPVQQQQQYHKTLVGSDSTTINVVANDAEASLREERKLEQSPKLQPSNTTGSDLESAAQTFQHPAPQSVPFDQSQASGVRFDFSQPAPPLGEHSNNSPFHHSFQPSTFAPQAIPSPGADQQASFPGPDNYWRPTNGNANLPPSPDSLTDDIAQQFKAQQQANTLPPLPQPRFQQLASPAPFLQQHHQQQQQPSSSRQQQHMHFTGHSFITSPNGDNHNNQQFQNSRPQQQPSLISVISGNDSGHLGSNAVSWNPPPLPPVVHHQGSTQPPPFSSTRALNNIDNSFSSPPPQFFQKAPSPSRLLPHQQPRPLNQAHSSLGAADNPEQPEDNRFIGNSSPQPQSLSTTTTVASPFTVSTQRTGPAWRPSTPASTTSTTTAQTSTSFSPTSNAGERDAAQSQPRSSIRSFNPTAQNGRASLSSQQFEPTTFATTSESPPFGMPATSSRQNRDPTNNFRPNSAFSTTSLASSTEFPITTTTGISNQNRFSTTLGPQSSSVTPSSISSSTLAPESTNSTGKKEDMVIYYYYYYDDNKNATVVAKNLSAAANANGAGSASMPLEAAIEADGGVEDTPYMEDPVQTQPPLVRPTSEQPPSRGLSNNNNNNNNRFTGPTFTTSTSTTTGLPPSLRSQTAFNSNAQHHHQPSSTTARFQPIIEKSNNIQTTTGLPLARDNFSEKLAVNSEPEISEEEENDNSPADQSIGSAADQFQNDPPARILNDNNAFRQNQPAGLRQPIENVGNQFSASRDPLSASFRPQAHSTTTTISSTTTHSAPTQHASEHQSVQRQPQSSVHVGARLPNAQQVAARNSAANQQQQRPAQVVPQVVAANSRQTGSAPLSNASRYGTSQNNLLSDPTFAGLDPSSGPVSAHKEIANLNHHHHHHHHHQNHHQQRQPNNEAGQQRASQSQTANNRTPWQPTGQQQSLSRATGQQQIANRPVQPPNSVETPNVERLSGDRLRPQSVTSAAATEASSGSIIINNNNNSGQFSSQRQPVQANTPATRQLAAAVGSRLNEPAAAPAPIKPQVARQFFPESTPDGQQETAPASSGTRQQQSSTITRNQNLQSSPSRAQNVSNPRGSSILSTSRPVSPESATPSFERGEALVPTSASEEPLNEDDRAPSRSIMGNGRPATAEGTSANGFTRAPPASSPSTPVVGQRLSLNGLTNQALSTTTTRNLMNGIVSTLAQRQPSSTSTATTTTTSTTRSQPSPSTTPSTTTTSTTTTTPSTLAQSLAPAIMLQRASTLAPTTSTTSTTTTSTTTAAPQPQEMSSGTTESSSDSPASTRKKFGNRNNRFQTRLTATRLSAAAQSAAAASASSSTTSTTSSTTSTTRRPFTSTTRKSSKQLFAGRARLRGINSSSSSTNTNQAAGSGAEQQPAAVVSGPTTEATPIQVSSTTGSSISASRARFGNSFTSRSRLTSTTGAPAASISSNSDSPKPVASLFGSGASGRTSNRMRAPFAKPVAVPSSEQKRSSATGNLMAANSLGDQPAPDQTITTSNDSQANNESSENRLNNRLAVTQPTMSITESVSVSSSVSSSSAESAPSQSSGLSLANQNNAGQAENSNNNQDGSLSSAQATSLAPSSTGGDADSASETSFARASTSKPKRPLFASRQRSSSLFGNRRNQTLAAS